MFPEKFEESFDDHGVCDVCDLELVEKDGAVVASEFAGGVEERVLASLLEGLEERCGKR